MNCSRFIFITLVALSITLQVPSHADEASPSKPAWPGWLGPNRDGKVSGFEVPSQWPAELNRIWKVEVGTGYGSPVVVGERVYQHARQGDNEVVFCLDLKSGKEIWRKQHEVYFTVGQGGQGHGKGPKSSPVFADGRLFTLSITGTLSTWDSTSGELLWRKDFRKRFKKNQPYWGVSTSPLVDGDKVVLQIGDDESGVLLALDTKTGEEKWSLGKDGTSYSSPLVIELEGVRQIAMWNHRAVVGVESKSGKLLWEFPFPHVGNNQNMPTPTFHNGKFLVGGENRGMHCFAPQLKGARWKVKKLWHQDEVALDMSTAVMGGDFLYGFSHYRGGQIFCLSPESGEVLWRGPGRTGQNVTFLSVPGHVLALVNDGELKVIQASNEGLNELKSYRVSDDNMFATWAPPVLLKDQLLIKDKESLALWSF